MIEMGGQMGRKVWYTIFMNDISLTVLTFFENYLNTHNSFYQICLIIVKLFTK